MYEDTPELLTLTMEISWTQNVVILEADMEPDERRWYLRAAGRFGWSKAELQRKIDSTKSQWPVSLNRKPAAD